MGKRALVYPNIRAELARNGLTVAMLADYMGMTTQNVYNKLNGKTAVNQKDMQLIQEFFRVKVGGTFTLDYLFKSGE
jgi:transcriptional regulator with XRE-family HTH domain